MGKKKTRQKKNKYAEYSKANKTSVPQTRIHTCANKVRHRTMAGAEAALRHMEETKGVDSDLRVYFCGLCGGYHLGRTKPQNQKE